MIQKLWGSKLTRFLCIGVCNTVLDFVLLNTFVFIFHVPALIANTISVCVGVTISFFLNHYIVFQKTSRPQLKSFGWFFLVTATSIVVVQTAVIAALSSTYTHLFHSLAATFHERSLVKFEDEITLNLAKATAVLVGMIWNYVLYSKFIFVKKVELEEV